MNIRLTSWWLEVGTTSFIIFVVTACVVLVLFLFLYFTVMSKLRKFILLHVNCSRALEKRYGLTMFVIEVVLFIMKYIFRADVLRRSAYVFSLFLYSPGAAYFI